MSRLIIDSTQTLNLIPSAYDSVNSVVDSSSNVTRACKHSGSTMNYSIFYLAMNLNVDTWVYYDFDYSQLPSDHIIINNVYCDFTAISYSSSTSYIKDTYGCLSIGATPRLIPTTVYSNSTSTLRINPNHEFTREEVGDVKLCLHAERGSYGATSTSVNIKLYGADLYIDYSIYHYEYDIDVLSNTSKITVPTNSYTISEGNSQTIEFNISDIRRVSVEDNSIDVTSQLVNTSGTTWTYTLSDIQDDHIITCNDLVVEFDEDPQYTYHTVSISALNADTMPIMNSYRYVEGSNIPIDITPSESGLTLALDNGVDISSQIVLTSQYNTTFSTSNISGTTAWVYDSSTGYYHNGNAGSSSSRSNIQLNFSLDVPCLVTIYYWGSLRGNDAFCVGNINQTLNTSFTQDSTYKYWKGGSDTFNITEENPTAISFDEINSGDYIQIKVRRNDTTAGTEYHTIYFKVEITPLVPLNYRYTITNIQEDHSIVLVYGDVIYYVVNVSSNETDLKYMPYGDWICLPDDVYKLTIIPSDPNIRIVVSDNNVQQTPQRIESLDDNNEVVVNYVYRIYSVNENHSITISKESSPVYIKVSGQYIQAQGIYKKENGTWVKQESSEGVFDLSKIYITM